MLGALIGDIAGSKYEFSKQIYTSDMKLIDQESSYTDDSVMTIAVKDILVSGNISEKNIIETMVRYGKKYPAKYGNKFSLWIREPKPYASKGNGSIMRVSPLYDIAMDTDKKIELANKITSVSHNHPDSIRAVDCIIELAESLKKCGLDSNKIKRVVTKHQLTIYEYQDLPSLGPSIFAIPTLELVISVLLVSESFEQGLKKMLCLGGDTDTNASILGGLLELVYEIPVYLKDLSLGKIPEEWRCVISKNITLP